MSLSRDFSGDPGGDGNLGLPCLTEDVGVVPLEGGVALDEVLDGGLLEGVTPRGGVAGGVVESLKCGFLGGLSGGKLFNMLGDRLCQIGVDPVLELEVPLLRIWALDSCR